MDEASGKAGRAFLRVLSILHGQEGAIQELVQAQVPASRILALYPLDTTELVVLVRLRLNPAEGVQHFVETMQAAQTEELNELYDALALPNYDELERQEGLLFSKHRSLNDLAGQLVPVTSGGRETAYSKVRDALTVTAGLLWFGARFRHLPELHPLESRLAALLDLLSVALTPPSVV